MQELPVKNQGRPAENNEGESEMQKMRKKGFPPDKEKVINFQFANKIVK